MAITATRLRILESQQTGIAKKVYAAVPIVEPWSSTDIANELHRTGGPRDLRMIEKKLLGEYPYGPAKLP